MNQSYLNLLTNPSGRILSVKDFINSSVGNYLIFNFGKISFLEARMYDSLNLDRHRTHWNYVLRSYTFLFEYIFSEGNFKIHANKNSDLSKVRQLFDIVEDKLIIKDSINSLFDNFEKVTDKQKCYILFSILNSFYEVNKPSRFSDRELIFRHFRKIKRRYSFFQIILS